MSLVAARDNDAEAVVASVDIDSREQLCMHEVGVGMDNFPWGVVATRNVVASAVVVEEEIEPDSLMSPTIQHLFLHWQQYLKYCFQHS